MSLPDSPLEARNEDDQKTDLGGIRPAGQHDAGGLQLRYEARLDYDPFSDSKLAVAMANLTDRSRSGLAPDRNRRREVLENFPLDTVRLVGHLQNKTNGNVALLSVDNVVYQARVGNYVGQNYGRIVKITETEMGIKELVRDATGDWVEQDTTLALEDEPKP